MMRARKLRSQLRSQFTSLLLTGLCLSIVAVAPAWGVDDPETLGPWKVGHRETNVLSPPHLPVGARPLSELVRVTIGGINP